MARFKIIALIVLVSGMNCKPRIAANASQSKEAWDDINDPVERLGLPLVKYDDIPPEAFLKTLPWAGYYWASYRMGIAYRWQKFLSRDAAWFRNAEKEQFDLGVPSAEQIKSLNSRGIAELSPAEKYDVLLGQDSLPLTNAVRDAATKYVEEKTLKIPRWFGICHGWAPAASLVPEPGQILQIPAKNDPNRCVTFYRDDLKALASQVYSYGSFEKVFIGGRCNRSADKVERLPNNRIATPECQDVNAGALHVALTQLILQNIPFVADVEYSKELWNQPIYGYKVKYLRHRAFNVETDKLASFRKQGHKVLPTSLVDVEMKLYYVTESTPGYSEQPGDFLAESNYNYTLELDKEDRVIGGEWDNQGTYPLFHPIKNPDNPEENGDKSKHPDFLWVVQSAPEQIGDLDVNEVNRLIELSRSAQPRLCRADVPSIAADPASKETGKPAPVKSLTKTSNLNKTGKGKAESGQWTKIEPPRDPKWQPSLDREEVFCNTFRSKEECNDEEVCGWSASLKTCIYVAHEICNRYLDSKWCITADGCKWIDPETGKSTKSTNDAGVCTYINR